MLRIIAAGDFHLTLRESHGVTSEDGLNSRLHDKLKAIRESVNYAIENKADMYISLGDEFDSLNPSELLRYEFIKTMSPIFKHNIRWRLIMGNHVYNATYYNLQSEEMLLNSIGSSNFEIISKPKIEEINGINLSYLPWTYIEDAKKFLSDNPNRIVFGHMPIKGALLNDYEIVSKEGIDDTSNQKFIIMGHYHKFQEQDNWIYVGSIVTQDFSERNQQKGFLDIKIDEQGIHRDFITIKDRPFIQLEFSEPNNPIEYINQVNSFNGAIIKTKFKGTNKWIYSINKTEFSKICTQKGAMKLISPEIEVIDESSDRLTFSKNSTFDTNIEEYCKSQKRLDVIDEMKEILNEVIETRREL